jgi:hypothetical protein
VSEKTRTAVHKALATAVRRGILVNDGDGLHLDCATIDDYPRDLLVESLLGRRGRTWCDREDAIHATAYRLGFRRVGPKIRQRLRAPSPPPSAVEALNRRVIRSGSGDNSDTTRARVGKMKGSGCI